MLHILRRLSLNTLMQDTTDEDSDFEEGYRRKQKPVKLKIKKEKREGVDYSEEEDSTESDWEPEAEIVPQAREKSRSGRQRKRPSFFQEFESQENNLDSILAEFEQTQVTTKTMSLRVNPFHANITHQFIPGCRIRQTKTTKTSKATGRKKAPEEESPSGCCGAS